MAEPDYYELFGLTRQASLKDIRSVFRQKVLAEHPDKGGDQKKFQLLNKAYNVLTDSEKRARYNATGSADVSAEEEFAKSFGGGRLHAQQRSKQADAEAVVHLEQRMPPGEGAHEDGFHEWLRQRDQSEMLLTDKDFMKAALFNAADSTTKINHSGPVQNVLGYPRTDAYGEIVTGPIQVQTKPRPTAKNLDHSEILVRMLAVPLDDSMVYAQLEKSGICLGNTGVGRIEQVGSRVEAFKPDDCVIVLPTAARATSSRPVGTARTLLTLQQDDLMTVDPEILEQLTPEQICLAPTIVCAYLLLELYGGKLKPGDSVLLNGAHMSACGSSLLQLCRLLKLKPICLLDLPGCPKATVRGEHGSKHAWQDAEAKTSAAPPAARQHYDKVHEWLMSMGAEEVFPDAAALLKWRDRNQRMLPKLGLDGLSTGTSTEQLIHCLQAHEDSLCVVYGHGQAAVKIPPTLISSWGGTLLGFNLNRWVHSLSANQAYSMTIMANVTKLIRNNKFTIDTVIYKVGEDAISDAFSRAADASDSSQVVLIFPTLQEEIQNHGGDDARQHKAAPVAAAPPPKIEEDETEKLKEEWLNRLFTDGSVAATSPEGPLPTVMEAGNTSDPSALIVWVGDDSDVELPLLKEVAMSIPRAAMVFLSWAEHPAGEGVLDLDLTARKVLDGSWYTRDRPQFENEDLDQLHDIELLGRCMVESVETVLAKYGLTWRHVVLSGFGKGAGIAYYAASARLSPQTMSGGVFFNAVIPFPLFLAEKATAAAKTGDKRIIKLLTVWGGKDEVTPANYRQQLAQATRSLPQMQSSSDTIAENGHIFDDRAADVLVQVLPTVLPR